MIDYSKTYIQYADDVVNRRILACENIILSCQRFLDWFSRDDIYFDYEDVDRKIRVVSRLKHTTGEHNGKPFIMLPWQQWVTANIFGFKYRSSGYRVTKNVLLMIARKGGKTSFAAALGILCAIADNENGAEIELVANSRHQAKIAFEQTSNFCESVDRKNKIFKRYRDSVLIPKTKSKIQVLSSDSMGNDGYNASCFILDEFHAARDWGLYNVMKSSQGMRRQPLGIVISTAGFLLNGYPMYEYRETCINILKGNKDDDSQFSAIYELDEGDDWKDESLWIKCQPSLGQTVSLEFMRDEVKSAINNPALETGVRTRNFNQFVQSKDVWIPDSYLVDAFKKIYWEDFKDEDCYMGVDLSAVHDLTSTSVLFPPNEGRKVYPDKFVFFNTLYVPESTFEESINSDLYKLWKRQGYAKITSGNVVDYDFILKDQKQVYEDTYLLRIGYDQWNSTQWAINATSEGLPLFPYSQAIGAFNKPTKEFERLIRSGQVVIAYNPAVRWCFNNVEIKRDWSDNCLALDTEVPTPDGFKTINDLKVGDYVFDETGKPTKIVDTTDVHYGRDCYKITFRNGSSVVCDNTHRWYVNYTSMTKDRKTIELDGLKDTEWIYNHQNKQGKLKRHTYYTQPVEYSEKTYTVDPYTLGQWLGDGSSWSSTFSCAEEDLIMYDHLKDKYTVNYVYDEGKTYIVNVSKGKSCLRSELKDLGLLKNKHIPEEYLQGSIEQRLELLRGLMDTDGSCNKYNGQCTFTQSSNRSEIIEGMRELLNSLGIRHSIVKYNTYSLITFYTDIRVFNLERKYERQKKWINSRPIYNTIMSIEKVDSVPTKCITVENDNHLFLISRQYTITSNCKPVKAGGDNSKKIDPVISMIEALGTYLEHIFGGKSDGEILAVGLS